MKHQTKLRTNLVLLSLITGSMAVACSSKEQGAATKDIATNLGESGTTYYYKVDGEDLTRARCLDGHSTISLCQDDKQSVGYQRFRSVFAAATRESIGTEARQAFYDLLESPVAFRPMAENQLMAEIRPAVRYLDQAFEKALTAVPYAYLNYLANSSTYSSPSDFACRYSFSSSSGAIMARISPRSPGDSCASTTITYNCDEFENICRSADEAIQVCSNGDLQISQLSSGRARRYYLGGHETSLSYQPCVIETPAVPSERDQVDGWFIRAISYREYRSNTGRDLKIEWQTSSSGLLKETVSLEGSVLYQAEYKLRTDSGRSPHTARLELTNVLSGHDRAPAMGTVIDCSYTKTSSSWTKMVNIRCPSATWGGIPRLPSTLEML